LGLVQGKATLETPSVSVATPSNLGAGSSFASALPTGFITGFIFPVCNLIKPLISMVNVL